MEAEATPRRAKAQRSRRREEAALLEGSIEERVEALNPQQRRGFLMVTQPTGRRPNTLFTGGPGTGKTFLARVVYDQLREKGVDVALTAMTGAAAARMGGRTFHSFVGLMNDVYESDAALIKALQGKADAVKRIREVEVLIVDEISMMAAATFSAFSHAFAVLREDPRPWGGAQVVVVGDFLQLPPVVDERRAYLMQGSGLSQGEYSLQAYTSIHWKVAGLEENVVLLTEVMRTRDPLYIMVLSDFRLGKLPPEAREILEGRVVKGMELRFLDPESPTPRRAADPTDWIRYAGCTVICGLRDTAARYNGAMNALLPGPPYLSKSTDHIDPVWATSHPGRAERILEDSGLPAAIEMRVGTVVMHTSNRPDIKLYGGIPLVNGSRGEITAFEVDASLGPLPWVYFYRYNDPLRDATTREERRRDSIPIVPEVRGLQDEEGRYLVSRTGLPLLMGWALTVHKAMGATMAKVLVVNDLFFEWGQAYVAISRCTSLDGLFLWGLPVPHTNPMDLAFYDRMRYLQARRERGTPLLSLMRPAVGVVAPPPRAVRERASEAAMRMEGVGEEEEEEGEGEGSPTEEEEPGRLATIGLIVDLLSKPMHGELIRHLGSLRIRLEDFVATMYPELSSVLVAEETAGSTEERAIALEDFERIVTAYLDQQRGRKRRRRTEVPTEEEITIAPFSEEIDLTD